MPELWPCRYSVSSLPLFVPAASLSVAIGAPRLLLVLELVGRSVGLGEVGLDVVGCIVGANVFKGDGNAVVVPLPFVDDASCRDSN